MGGTTFVLGQMDWLAGRHITTDRQTGRTQTNLQTTSIKNKRTNQAISHPTGKEREEHSEINATHSGTRAVRGQGKCTQKGTVLGSVVKKIHPVQIVQT